MTGHIHAELMKQYAEDAAETDKPWEGWEKQLAGGLWVACPVHPDWHARQSYRRKPQTITVNGIEVPEPMRKAPLVGEKYWIATPDGPSLFHEIHWDNGTGVRMWHERGLVHLSKYAAIQHARALIAASGGEA